MESDLESPPSIVAKVKMKKNTATEGNLPVFVSVLLFSFFSSVIRLFSCSFYSITPLGVVIPVTNLRKPEGAVETEARHDTTTTTTSREHQKRTYKRMNAQANK